MPSSVLSAAGINGGGLMPLVIVGLGAQTTLLKRETRLGAI